jgi:hypothetical protein
MFWFISPWEAARRSLEAQRHLMALPWIFMASARRYQARAVREQDPSEAPPSPARSMAPERPAAVPARRAIQTIKGPVGVRGKDKRSSKRKNKRPKE